MHQVTMTLKKPISQNGVEQLTLFRADSLVNPIQTLDNEKAKKMNAICGPKCAEQYARLNQVSSWAKMFVDSLIGTGEWYSTRCKLIWSLRGTKSRPWLYLRRVSMPHTAGTGFSLLLKTPAAMDAYSGNLSKTEQRFGNSGTLAQEVSTGFIYQRGMLPTPNTTPRRRTEQQLKARQEKYGGTTRAMYLEDFAMMGMLPTQTNPTGTDSQLNPRFVAEMMGFPPNWTELPFQNGEKNR